MAGTAGAGLRTIVGRSQKENGRKGREVPEGKAVAAGNRARRFTREPGKTCAERNFPSRTGRTGGAEETRRAGRIGKKSRIGNCTASRGSQGQGTNRSGICFSESGSTIGKGSARKAHR